MIYQEDVPFLFWHLWTLWLSTVAAHLFLKLFYTLFILMSRPLQSDFRLRCSHGLALTKISSSRSPIWDHQLKLQNSQGILCSWLLLPYCNSLLCHRILLWFLSGHTQPPLFSSLSLRDLGQMLLFKCHSYHMTSQVLISSINFTPIILDP